MTDPVSKSAVKVICRLRPTTSSTSLLCDLTHITTTDDQDFHFHAALDSSSTQTAAYETVGGVGLLRETLKEGYNFTIAAYGQTGSGKTHTMMGTEKDPGIIPRLAVDLFVELERLAKYKSAMYATVRVSFVEIYRERLRDLLNVASTKPLKIRDYDRTAVMIEGAVEEFVSSSEELLGVLKRGNAARTVAYTRMNDDSSRSHSVFTLKIELKDGDSGMATDCKIQLVDLAGSEKIKRTGAEGDRLEEAKAINQSLSALGNVINALVEHRSHVPYRDSKLTRLLQDSLGGTAKCILIVTASPAVEDYAESISTLRFGQRAQKVENRVVKNVRRTAQELERLLAVAEDKIRFLLSHQNPNGGDGVEQGSARMLLEDHELRARMEEEKEDLQGRVEELEIELERIKLAYENNNSMLHALEQEKLKREIELSEAVTRERKLILDLESAREELEARSLAAPEVLLEAPSTAPSTPKNAQQNNDIVEKPLPPVLEMTMVDIEPEISMLSLPSSPPATFKTFDASDDHPPSPFRTTPSIPRPAMSPAREERQFQEDMSALTERCVNLQMMICEKDDEIALLKSGKLDQVWLELRNTQVKLKSSDFDKDRLRSDLAIANRQTKNRKELIELLEKAAAEVQANLLGKVFASELREQKLKEELKAYRLIKDVVSKPLRWSGGSASSPSENCSMSSASTSSPTLSSSPSSSTAIVPFTLSNKNKDALKVKLLPERLFFFGQEKITIKQSWKLDGRGGTRLGFGSCVYPAASALSDFIAKNCDFGGKRVLEIGCGVGLLSIVAKKCCKASFVLATDGDSTSVDLTKENIMLNDLDSSAIGVCKLMWGAIDNEDFVVLEGGGSSGGSGGNAGSSGHSNDDNVAAAKTTNSPFEIILASDVVANPYFDELPKLLETFVSLRERAHSIGLGGFEILLGFTPRHAREQQFFKWLKENGFAIKTLECDPEFEDVKLFSIR